MLQHPDKCSQTVVVAFLASSNQHTSCVSSEVVVCNTSWKQPQWVDIAVNILLFLACIYLCENTRCVLTCVYTCTYMKYTNYSHYQPFVEVCIKHGNRKEAVKYIPKCAVEDRYHLYIKVE